MATTIRVPDLAARLSAVGLTPAQLSLARLTPSQIALLERGDAVTVPDAEAVADLLACTEAELAVGTPSPPSADDREPVLADAPRPAPRDELSEVPSTPPMEAALRAVLAETPGAYREEDLELVAAVLGLGETPSGLSRRALETIARTWLDLAVTIRGTEDAVPALLDAAGVSDEPRVRAMAAGIRRRAKAQTRTPAPSKKTKKSEAA